MQVAHPERRAVLLIIRRSWVRAPPAPPDPLIGREIRFGKTCKTERAAQIELGKLLAMAQAGRQPDSDVTVAQLLDQYVSTAGWDMSTRESNLGYIRRIIKPALGSTQVRKVRGPLLDTLYAGLMRCGNLACTGKPFTEHLDIPAGRGQLPGVNVVTYARAVRGGKVHTEAQQPLPLARRPPPARSELAS